jgi:hypothetical protein
VIIVVTALRQQRTEGYTPRKLFEQFGVTRLTLERWLAYFRELFPLSKVWQALRSRFIPPVAIESIPLAILERLDLSRGDPQSILIRCLFLLVVGTA